MTLKIDEEYTLKRLTQGNRVNKFTAQRMVKHMLITQKIKEAKTLKDVQSILQEIIDISLPHE